MSTQPEFIKPSEVARRLSVSTQTVLNKGHSGEWEWTKLAPRIYRFTEEQYEAIAQGVTETPRRSRKSKMHEALKVISRQSA